MSKKQSIVYEDKAARQCKWCFEDQKDSVHRLLHEANCPAKLTNAQIDEQRIAASNKRYEEKLAKREKKNMKKKKKGSGSSSSKNPEIEESAIQSELDGEIEESAIQSELDGENGNGDGDGNM